MTTNPSEAEKELRDADWIVFRNLAYIRRDTALAIVQRLENDILALSLQRPEPQAPIATVEQAVKVLNGTGYQCYPNDAWQVSDDRQWVYQHPDPETVVRKSAEDAIAIANSIIAEKRVAELERTIRLDNVPKGRIEELERTNAAQAEEIARLSGVIAELEPWVVDVKAAEGLERRYTALRLAAAVVRPAILHAVEQSTRGAVIGVWEHREHWAAFAAAAGEEGEGDG